MSAFLAHIAVPLCILVLVKGGFDAYFYSKGWGWAFYEPGPDRCRRLEGDDACDFGGFVKYSWLLWTYVLMYLLFALLAAWPAVCWLSNQMIAAIEFNAYTHLLREALIATSKDKKSLQTEINALYTD